MTAPVQKNLKEGGVSYKRLSREALYCYEALQLTALPLSRQLRESDLDVRTLWQSLPVVATARLRRLASYLDAAARASGFLFLSELVCKPDCDLTVVGNLAALTEVCGYLEGRVLLKSLIYTLEGQRQLRHLVAGIELPEKVDKVNMLAGSLVGRDLSLPDSPTTLDILSHGNPQVSSASIRGVLWLLSISSSLPEPIDFLLAVLKSSPEVRWTLAHLEEELRLAQAPPADWEKILEDLLKQRRVQIVEGLYRWRAPANGQVCSPPSETPLTKVNALSLRLQELEPRLVGPTYTQAHTAIMVAYRELASHSRPFAKLLTAEHIDHEQILQTSLPESLRPVLATMASELDLATNRLGFLFVDRLRRECPSEVSFDLVRNMAGLAVASGDLTVSHLDKRVLYSMKSYEHLRDLVVQLGLPQPCRILNHIDIGQAGSRAGAPTVTSILCAQNPNHWTAQLNDHSVLLTLQGRPSETDLILGLMRTEPERLWTLDVIRRQLRNYPAASSIRERLEALTLQGVLVSEDSAWRLEPDQAAPEAPPVPEVLIQALLPHAAPPLAPIELPPPEPEEEIVEAPPEPSVEPEPPGSDQLWISLRPSKGGIFGVLHAPEPEIAKELLDDCPSLRNHNQGSYYFWKKPADCLRMLDEIKAYDVEVRWPKGQPFKVVGEIDKASFGAANISIATPGPGWLEIGGDIELPGNFRLPLFALLKKLQPDQDFVALSDGQYVRLEKHLRAQLEKLAALLEPPAQADAPETCSIRANLLPLLSDLELDFVDNTPGAQLQNRVRRWHEAQTLDIPIPDNLKGLLREYQVEGFRWLARRVHAGFGVCLADDMGLGKTLQVLCLLQAMAFPLESFEGGCFGRGPNLVIAPSSVTYNWQEQSERFNTGLRTVLYEGPLRAKLLPTLSSFDVVIASYGVLVNDRQLHDIPWNCVVLDEAQQIKTHTSVRAKAACALKSQARIAVSGTPIENNLLELWSLFRFLNPWLLGTVSDFRRRYEKASYDNVDHSRAQLKALVRPFMLRRTKLSVTPELPAKTETVFRIELSTEERAVYEAIRQHALGKAGDDEEGRLELLNSLLKLRQACCHPALISEVRWESPLSSKVSALLESLGECLPEGHRVLVFSSFVRLLEIVSRELDRRKISHQMLYGATPTARRREMVESFSHGEFPVFLISLKAGGTGLTLTEADHVFHLDPWWNPAAEDQATDRAHRIGQTKPVTVYKFVARDTVEERVIALHESKRELVATVIDENGGGSAPFSIEELRGLM